MSEPIYDAMTGAIPAVGGTVTPEGCFVTFKDAYVVSFMPRTSKEGRLYGRLKFAAFGDVFDIYVGSDDVLSLQADGVVSGSIRDFTLRLSTRRDGQLMLSF